MPETSPRVRRTAEDRRKQLIGIGLEKLRDRPWHQITVDSVAAEAGISRGLLFHYFPTKQDYYAELMRAGARRLLRATRVDDAVPAGGRVRAMVDGYVRFLERRRAAYLSVMAAAAVDPDTREVHDQIQSELAGRLLDALRADGVVVEGAWVTSVVRSWWSFAEDLTVRSTATDDHDRDRLVQLLVNALGELVAVARR
ncbi:TetR/AcrR family transcriptional regulator [Rhodococcus sp. D2-41]|uniref:TetR/AcrR family transcriptional regulator n=1 Tax=Speluncibacter jeojiensis TaxID=2710754 RepID=A0A9X4RC24_9ACTN|nr:TetR/AcrR family transcriptional regulator [Rhodococcus sp. D2-41]MDG3008674.1 TetR/AcrR family transcriptional regulator [Rhodococcus sp. D2-41]MDG3013118.1 TetR/AcrR family transcriptional regulator [Corynebacteriales bacterium D3-21]